MGYKSKIGWTDNTFNGWIGCKHVSPGCAHCYAETLNNRMGWTEWGKTYYRTSEDLWKKPIAWNKKYPGDTVFCQSMSDILDPDVPWEWRRDLWALIRETPDLHWLLLTKRPEEWMLLPADMPSNVWFGVSIENQAYRHRLLGLLVAKDRLNIQHTFVSFEPLIGKVEYIEDYFKYGVPDWIIIGGESGPKCRPMKEEWAEQIILEAKAYNIPIFVKQMGGHPDKRENLEDLPEHLRKQQIPEQFWTDAYLDRMQLPSGEKRSPLQDTDQGKGKSLSG
jgi:protein gp37